MQVLGDGRRIVGRQRRKSGEWMVFLFKAKASLVVGDFLLTRNNDDAVDTVSKFYIHVEHQYLDSNGSNT